LTSENIYENETNPTSRATKTHLPCPKCNSSDAYSLYEDGHGYCFSCTAYVPAEDGIGEVDTDEEEADLISYEYLPWRGISQATMRYYDVKTKVLSDGKPANLIFPYNNASKLRLVDEKQFWSKGAIAKAGLFGADKFSSGSSKAVTVCEGETDTLSTFQMLGSKYPTLGVQSASTAKRDCTVSYEYLNSFDKIYICFDNDEPGHKAAKQVAELFDYQKIYFVKLTLKDATDYLQSGRINEFRNIWFNSKRFLPDNVISSLDAFKKIVTEETNQKGLLFPYKCLNSKTFGLRTGEITLVTAQEGVGKTEFIRGIEYKILKETDDNLALIHLEENKTRLLKGFVGLELGVPVHIPSSSVSQDQIEAAIDSLVKRDDRLHIYSHFGSDDPDVILGVIRFLVSAAKCRYVTFDHITMVTSGSGQEERIPLDQLSTKLRMLVDELDFALILVSHLNKEGTTRGSANISKIADTWINLDRDLEANSEAVRNTTELTLKKNRFFGETGPAGSLKFDKEKFCLVDKF
jgi:twinkle protein